MGQNKSEQLHIRLSKTHKKMLDAICEKDKKSKTEMVESWIADKFVSNPDYKTIFYQK